MARSLIALVVIACSGAPAPAADDAGVALDPCETDAGDCVRRSCQLERLRVGAAACSTDDDCTVFTFPPNCVDFGRCGVAVSFVRESAYSIEASRVISGSCSCRASACDRRAMDVRCRAQSCVLELRDAGVVDAGVDGGR